ncbi:MAG: 4Fe-4S dicluster domain-containing protein [Bacteroidetes bacterium]|nr:4Fe-4S dicluster domain-containing protein [Bacteroidota bacterium]
MKREIIKIDEDKCNGCGLCIPGCPEGALQMIDGKARLVSDLMCDGLGACIGECPEGAIEIEEREAEPYDEVAVVKEILTKGENTLIAHLSHLQDHGELGFLKQATDYLSSLNEEPDFNLDAIILNFTTMDEQKESNGQQAHGGGGCPGSSMKDFSIDENQMNKAGSAGSQPSALRQWPVQMHLVNPNAPYYRNTDVVLAADCVAFSMGNFHQDYLAGKGVAIACPKLDQGSDIYIEKLCQMIDEAQINTLNVMIMEVPCCGGLIQMARMAQEKATRKIPVKQTVVSIKGEVLAEEWV